MKPDIIKDEIRDIFESLQEQIPVLINYTDKIPQIELDIVMSNLRKLYENISELKCIDLCAEEGEEKAAGEAAEKIEGPAEEIAETQLSASASEAGSGRNEEEEAAGAAEEKIEESVEEIAETPLIASVSEAAAGKNEEEEAAGAAEEKIAETQFIASVSAAAVEEEYPIIEEYETPVREPVKIVFESKEDEIILPKKKQVQDVSTIDLFSTSNKSVSDNFKADSKSINEIISGDKEDKSVAAKIQKEHIWDLKLAIGLNEKFLFINELFDGNMKSYSEVITQLNDLETVEEALKTFEEIKLKNNWDDTADSYKKLLSLLERRF